MDVRCMRTASNVAEKNGKSTVQPQGKLGRDRPLVLVVDDDPTLREIMRHALIHAGFDVEDRENGKAGLEVFAELAPDLLLLDVMMPGMDGYAVCREIRSHRNGKHFPIVMVTGLEDTVSIDQAYEAGATDFVTKPLNVDVLGHRIRYILRASKAESEVAAAHARLKDAIESIPAELTIYDADDRLVLGNTRVYENNPELATVLRTGSSYDELLRTTAEAGLVMDAQGREEHWFLERRALHASAESTSVHERRDGRWVQLFERRTSEGGTVNVGVDITDLKAREKALEQAKMAAEAGDRAKTEFLANTGHELRTPLNAVLGFAQIMESELHGPLGSPEYREYAHDILQSGEHLLAVVNDILDMSKIEAGKLELHEDEIDLGEVLDACIPIVRGQAEDAGLDLTVSVPCELPRIHADPMLVKKMVINLLSNAVKFTEPGGSVNVSIQFDRCNGPSLCVQDTGIGMRAEDIPRVLMPFEQVDGALARNYEGTGLGLSLTKSMIELHGGAIEIESRLGVGTAVRLQFPNERVSGSRLASSPVGEMLPQPVAV